MKLKIPLIGKLANLIGKLANLNMNRGGSVCQYHHRTPCLFNLLTNSYTQKRQFDSPFQSPKKIRIIINQKHNFTTYLYVQASLVSPLGYATNSPEIELLAAAIRMQKDRDRDRERDLVCPESHKQAL
ncbi:hypothetical protein Csa_018248 [Cucumis sativus]|uniref:Uncharacterized protein n=1 Tax=Cucumis sativus TaxID=3659 RepID=A0A0A0KD93_CUCSA|nr:hypothetical protein Csa_018248 [Cucumis sativus]